MVAGPPKSAAVRRAAQLIIVGFLLIDVLGTVLLLIPAASETGTHTDFLRAWGTATGAMCGALPLVDPGTHFSVFGEIVLMALMQIGGLGVMTLASLLGLTVSRRLNAGVMLSAQQETGAGNPNEVSRLVLGVITVSLIFEAFVLVLLAPRFILGYDKSVTDGFYEALFHSISAFNNAGFSLYSNSLSDFASDPWVCVPIIVAMVAGSLGFPVLFELRRHFPSPKRWSMHTKVTIGMSAALLFGGSLYLTISEWTNAATMGPLSVPGKALAGLFQSATTRSTGFNTIDISKMNEESWLAMDVLMFIGGGSASPAGGIKVTTFALLGFVILAELRGETDVHVMGRRLPTAVQRQALSVALLGVAAIVGPTLAILAMSEHTLDEVLFEVCSAFGTAGLSVGVAQDLPAAGTVLLVLLELLGRLGPITLGTALALRERPTRYRLPEERPLVG